MNIKAIEQAYEGMLAAAFPSGCTETQRKAMRDAFFGGCLWTTDFINRDNDKDATMAINTIIYELNDFAEEVAKRAKGLSHE